MFFFVDLLQKNVNLEEYYYFFYYEVLLLDGWISFLTYKFLVLLLAAGFIFW